MQATTSVNIHKRNLQRETDSIRYARARQQRLDELGEKIERAKHKSLRSSYHEKAKVLNELSSIHRVFEPLYVIHEDQGTTHSEVEGIQGTVQNAKNCAGEVTNTFVKLPRLLKRSESESATLEGRHTTSQANVEKPPPLQPRSYSWSPQSPSSKSKRRHYAFQNKREYIAKLRIAAEEPRVSDSMSSVTMGYLAFKRVVKNTRRPENTARKFGDSNCKFRSMSLNETELTVIPELIEEIDANEQRTFSAQTSSATVNKVNKQMPDFSRHLLAPVAAKPQLSSTLSWPLCRLPKKFLESRESYSPHEILHAKEVQKEEKTQQQRLPLEKDINLSIKEDEEQKFALFDENPKEKIRFHKNRNIRFSETSKLIKAMGTGCFSKSFKDVDQSKK